jgi:D-sedoheptulose 7-phosphate isomerase
MNTLNHSDKYFKKLKKAIDSTDKKKISELINKIHSVIGTDETIFIAGNGGSASTASHMACDFGKTILGKKPREKSKRLRVICLNDNIPLMTAWGNDEGYEHIFSQQLINLAKKNDFLIIITGSGNSSNALEAISVAKNIGVKTYGILGFDGGKAKDILDDYLLIKSDDYGIIEDMHMILVHLITDWLKKQ